MTYFGHLPLEEMNHALELLLSLHWLWREPRAASSDLSTYIIHIVACPDINGLEEYHVSAEVNI